MKGFVNRQAVKLGQLRKILRLYESTLRRISHALTAVPRGIKVRWKEDEPLSVSITLRNRKGRAYALTATLEDLLIRRRHPHVEILLFMNTPCGDLNLVGTVKIGQAKKVLKRLLKELTTNSRSLSFSNNERAFHVRQ